MDAEWINERCFDLARLAGEFQGRHGFPPRPALLLEMLAKGEGDRAGGQPAKGVPASGPEAKRTRLGAPEGPPPLSAESAGSNDGAKQDGAGADTEGARARAEIAGNTGGTEGEHDGVEAEKNGGVKEENAGVKEEDGGVEEGGDVGEEEGEDVVGDVYTALGRSLRAVTAARARLATAVQEDDMEAATLAKNDINRVKVDVGQLRVCQVCWLARPSGACLKAGPETWYGGLPRKNTNGVNTIYRPAARLAAVPGRWF